MKPAVTTGDIPLAARPATAETFAPFGTLLAAGDNLLLGRPGRTLLSLAPAEPGARRVTHLTRYPHARRAVIASGDVPMWIVVLGPGDPPARPPAAFTIAPGTAVVIGAGTWHGGPYVLAPGTVTELLETRGGSDHLDRVALPDLVGATALRVVLPEEPGAPGPGLDLGTPHAVRLADELRGHLRLACLAFEDLTVGPASEALRAELEDAAEALRAAWGRRPKLAAVPGIGAARALFEGLGLDPKRTPPAGEVLLRDVCAGASPPAEDTLRGALALEVLKTRAPVCVYDAARIGEAVLARRGVRGESLRTGTRKLVRLAGRPLLCDAAGPFGSLLGDARRADVGPATRRAVVVVYGEANGEPAEDEALLDGIAETVVRHAGGSASLRLLVG